MKTNKNYSALWKMLSEVTSSKQNGPVSYVEEQWCYVI